MKKLALALAFFFCLASAIPSQAECIAGKAGDVFASFPEVATPFGAKMGMPGHAFPELRQKKSDLYCSRRKTRWSPTRCGMSWPLVWRV